MPNAVLRSLTGMILSASGRQRRAIHGGLKRFWRWHFTVAHGEDQFVVIDTAPTGHTLLLLDAAEAYHREVLRKASGTSDAVQRLLPRLRDSAGHVVLINSGSGLKANPRWGAYAASKFALRAYADVLRAEEEPNGLRVTSPEALAIVRRVA